jgi:hypothetical protein
VTIAINSLKEFLVADVCLLLPMTVTWHTQINGRCAAASYLLKLQVLGDSV